MYRISSFERTFGPPSIYRKYNDILHLMIIEILCQNGAVTWQAVISLWRFTYLTPAVVIYGWRKWRQDNTTHKLRARTFSVIIFSRDSIRKKVTGVRDKDGQWWKRRREKNVADCDYLSHWFYDQIPPACFEPSSRSRYQMLLGTNFTDWIWYHLGGIVKKA